MSRRVDAPTGSRWLGTGEDNNQPVVSHAATAEQRYNALIAASASVVWRATPDGAITEAWGWNEYSGQANQAYLGDGWLAALHPDDRLLARQRWSDALATGQLGVLEYRVGRPDGSYRWASARAVSVRDETGAITEWIGTVTDVHEHKLREQEARAHGEVLRLAVEATQLGIWEMDALTHRTVWSSQLKSLAGLEDDAEIDDDLFYGLVHPDDRQYVEQALVDVVNSRDSDPYEIVYRIRRADSREERWWHEWTKLTIGDDGLPSRLVGAIKDVTDEKAAELELEYAASHDALTGALNRSSLQAALDRATDSPAAAQINLFVIDIDHFKEINDTLGHDAGDCVLQTTAKRLAAIVGDAGHVARLGGDEFAVLATSGKTSASLHETARLMLEQLQKGFVYSGKSRPILASVGMTSYPGLSRHPFEMLKDADLALYAAKADGRSRVAAFTPQMRLLVEQRSVVLSEVKLGLDFGQFRPFYQPKIDMVSGNVVGFEALARWVHPTRGVLTPAAFSAAFEDAELAVAIGAAILSEVIRDLKRWLYQGERCGRISVNLSPFDFAYPDLSDRLLTKLDAAGIPSSHFEVEVTETVLLDRAAHSIEASLRGLHDKGVTISLDDFGTGYASLIHLKRFPVDEIKIDKSFIRNLESDAEDEAIVCALVNLANSMGLTAIAEGVENPGQATKLLAMGCQYAQGFLYAKPMAASRVPWFLAHKGSMSKHGHDRADPAAKPSRKQVR